MTSDIDLLRAYKNDRDKASINELFGRHYGAVYRVLLHLVNNSSDANDLTQQVFLKAIKGAENFEPIAPFRNWLLAIAANEAKNFFRTKSREAVRDPLFDLYLGAAREDQPEEDVQRREFEQQLELAFEKLPEKLRAPLVLHYYEDLSHAEIAEILSAPKATIKSRLETAIKRLRRIFKESGHAALIPLIAMFIPTAGKAAATAGAGMLSSLAKAFSIGGVVKTKVAVVCLIVIAASVFVAIIIDKEPPKNAGDIDAPAVAAKDPVGAPSIVTDNENERAEGGNTGSNAENEDVVNGGPDSGIDENAEVESEPIPKKETRTETFALSGFVVDADTQMPIEGANVRIDQKDVNLPDFQLVTNAQGYFTTDVPAGNYIVDVSENSRYKPPTHFRIVEVASSITLEFRLYPQKRQATIQGTITDAETGVPLEGYKIRWWAFEDRDESYSDIDGHYLIDVPSGEDIRISVYQEDRELASRYNRSPPEGETLTVDITIRPLEYFLRGSVIDANTKQPVAGAMLLNLENIGDYDPAGYEQCDEDGRFEWASADMLSGTLEVVHPGYMKYSMTLTEFTYASGNLEIALTPGTTSIVGEVTDAATGKPIPDAEILIKDIWKRRWASPQEEITLLSNREGEFTYTAAPSGYEVRCRMRGYQEHREYFKIDDNEIRRLEIKMKSTGTRIKGTVVDGDTGKPVPEAPVEIKVPVETLGPVRESLRGLWFTTAKLETGNDGSFVAEVPPGVYRVWAESCDYRSNASEEFYISPGEDKVVEILIYRANLEIFGIVTDAVTCEPVIYEEGWVNIKFPPLFQSFIDSEIKPDGSYRFEYISAGKHLIICSVKGYYRYREEITVRSGEKLEHNIELEPLPQATAKVRGIVKHAVTGKALDGADVYAIYEDSVADVCYTDAEGRFEIVVPPGEILLDVSYSNGKHIYGKIEVTAIEGETQEVTVELPLDK